MRAALTAAEVDRYRRDGFVVIPDLLDPDELARWRDALARALDLRTEPPGGTAPIGIRQELWPTRLRFTQRMNLWQSSPDMRALLLDERLGRLAAQLAGVAGIRLWYDQSFVKRPWAGPTPLHQDNPYWSFTSPDALTLWVALDDADTTNGALCYLPGTHRRHEWRQAPGSELDSVFEVHPDYATIQPVFCPVPAGGAAWHNGLTVHGSGANLTPGLRRAINCAYMPDGATFNGRQNILTDEVFHRYQVGDVLADDTLNPLLHRAP